MPDRDPEPRDDVDPADQTHDPVDIPDRGTVYEPQHATDEGLTKALDVDPESEGGEE